MKTANKTVTRHIAELYNYAKRMKEGCLRAE